MENYQAWAEEVLEKVKEKMVWVSEKNKDIIPYTTDANGNYDDRSSEEKEWNHDDGLNWWTNGFWGGIMWLLYQDTQEEKYAQIARVSEQKMEKCFESYFGLHHDVGFMFLPTAVADYRLTGHEDSKRIAMHAANLLAGRFNPVGKFIRAWNQVPGSDTRGWAIIDCMFNICLLYWASEESADPRFRQIAMMHADTVMENFIRPDGSVCHIVEFDPETGVMVKSHSCAIRLAPVPNLRLIVITRFIVSTSFVRYSHFMIKTLNLQEGCLQKLLLYLIQFLTCRPHAVFLRQCPACPDSASYFFPRFFIQDVSDCLLVGIQIAGFAHLLAVGKPPFIHRNVSHDHRNLTG